MVNGADDPVYCRAMDYCHRHNLVDPGKAGAERAWGIRVSLPPGDTLRKVLGDEWESFRWFETEQERDIEAAEAAYAEALRLDPASADGRVGMAWVRGVEHEFEASIDPSVPPKENFDEIPVVRERPYLFNRETSE